MNNSFEKTPSEDLCSIYPGGIGSMLSTLQAENRLSKQAIASLIENQKDLKVILNSDLLEVLDIVNNGSDEDLKDACATIIENIHKNPLKAYSLIQSLKKYRQSVNSLTESVKQGVEDGTREANRIKKEFMDGIHSSIKLLSESLQTFFDHTRPGWGLYANLYSSFGIAFERTGIDSKIEANSVGKNVLKGGIDELLGVTHILNIRTKEHIWAIVEFVKDNWSLIVKDFFQSWTDIGKGFTMKGDPKKQYEFGRSLMQWLLTIAPLGRITTAISNGVSKGATATSKAAKATNEIARLRPRVKKIGGTNVSNGADVMLRMLNRSVDVTTAGVKAMRKSSYAFAGMDITVREFMSR